MQGPTNEAFVPTTFVIDTRILGVTTRRKVATRTNPWLLPAAVAKSPRSRHSRRSRRKMISLMRKEPGYELLRVFPMQQVESQLIRPTICLQFQ